MKRTKKLMAELLIYKFFFVGFFLFALLSFLL